jgi:hypothetical protein
MSLSNVPNERKRVNHFGKLHFMFSNFEAFLSFIVNVVQLQIVLKIEVTFKHYNKQIALFYIDMY